MAQKLQQKPVHTFYLWNVHPSGHFPLSNMYESLSFLAPPAQKTLKVTWVMHFPSCQRWTT